jgi:hypothetical protein
MDPRFLDLGTSSKQVTRGTVGPRDSLDDEKRKIPRPYWDSNSDDLSVSQPILGCYTDCVIVGPRTFRKKIVTSNEQSEDLTLHR